MLIIDTKFIVRLPMENLFIDKHQDNILGSNSCFDRVIIKGSIIPLAYQKGLLQFLCSHNIRLKDFVNNLN